MTKCWDGGSGLSSYVTLNQLLGGSLIETNGQNLQLGLNDMTYMNASSHL